MIQTFLADTQPHADAMLLIAQFGTAAGREAATRADHSRRTGNHLHLCRWRQVERLLEAMDARAATGTVH